MYVERDKRNLILLFIFYKRNKAGILESIGRLWNHRKIIDIQVLSYYDKYTPRGYANKPFGEDKMTEKKQETCCCHKTKERSEKEYKDLINRLNRIEGQVRGIKGMVEKDAYCTDILVQVEAVKAALNSFNKVLLANHIRTCVTNDIKAGKEETVDELVDTLQKLMK